jgi:hypothetical protein
MVEVIEIPAELARFELPEALQTRLQHLLDKQDSGDPLTTEERKEAEAIVDVADFLNLLRLRSNRTSRPA